LDRARTFKFIVDKQNDHGNMTMSYAQLEIL